MAQPTILYKWPDNIHGNVSLYHSVKKHSKNIVELRYTNKQATVLTVTFYTKGLHDNRQNK